MSAQMLRLWNDSVTLRYDCFTCSATYFVPYRELWLSHVRRFRCRTCEAVLPLVRVIRSRGEK